jgi:hypothetical protein
MKFSTENEIASMNDILKGKNRFHREQHGCVLDLIVNKGIESGDYTCFIEIRFLPEHSTLEGDIFSIESSLEKGIENFNSNYFVESFLEGKFHDKKDIKRIIKRYEEDLIKLNLGYGSKFH